MKLMLEHCKAGPVCEAGGFAGGYKLILVKKPFLKQMHSVHLLAL